MPDMNITYAELQSSASKLSQGKSQIDQELASLQNLIQNLVANGFTTDAASGAFENAYNEFTTGAKNVIAGLDQLSAYLNKAVEIYSQADQDLARALK